MINEYCNNSDYQESSIEPRNCAIISFHMYVMSAKSHIRETDGRIEREKEIRASVRVHANEIVIRERERNDAK